MRVEGDMRTERRKDVLLETTGGAASKGLTLSSNQHMGNEKGGQYGKQKRRSGLKGTDLNGFNCK